MAQAKAKEKSLKLALKKAAEKKDNKRDIHSKSDTSSEKSAVKDHDSANPLNDCRSSEANIHNLKLEFREAKVEESVQSVKITNGSGGDVADKSFDQSCRNLSFALSDTCHDKNISSNNISAENILDNSRSVNVHSTCDTLQVQQSNHQNFPRFPIQQTTNGLMNPFGLMNQQRLLHLLYQNSSVPNVNQNTGSLNMVTGFPEITGFGQPSFWTLSQQIQRLQQLQEASLMQSQVLRSVRPNDSMN